MIIKYSGAPRNKGGGVEQGGAKISEKCVSDLCHFCFLCFNKGTYVRIRKYHGNLVPRELLELWMSFWMPSK